MKCNQAVGTRVKIGVIVTMATETWHVTAIFGMWAKSHKIKFWPVEHIYQLLTFYKKAGLMFFSLTELCTIQNYIFQEHIFESELAFQSLNIM